MIWHPAATAPTPDLGDTLVWLLRDAEPVPNWVSAGVLSESEQARAANIRHPLGHSQFVRGRQILRSALALSILTGKPFKLINIRARRTKPGLAPQHLACVRAAANISTAQYKGGQIGSAVLYFEPGTCKAGPSSAFNVAATPRISPKKTSST